MFFPGRLDVSRIISPFWIGCLSQTSLLVLDVSSLMPPRGMFCAVPVESRLERDFTRVSPGAARCGDAAAFAGPMPRILCDLPYPSRQNADFVSGLRVKEEYCMVPYGSYGIPALFSPKTRRLPSSALAKAPTRNTWSVISRPSLCCKHGARIAVCLEPWKLEANCASFNSLRMQSHASVLCRHFCQVCSVMYVQ